MKFMHLSDLHIGKRVNEFSMLEDQSYILNQILQIAEDHGVEAVWIAGDVYDKAVPSAEAVQLFDGFLTRLAERKLPVFVISGNHDSPERIAFGARLFNSRGVYLSPVYCGVVNPVILEDAYGPVRVYLLPFLKPASVRHAFPGEEVSSYPEALELAIRNIQGKEIMAAQGEGNEECPTQAQAKKACSTQEQVQSCQACVSCSSGAVLRGEEGLAQANMQQPWDPSCRNVLLAHQFVTGSERSDSEECSVGGMDNVDARLFEEFDYVALGHIHKPQQAGGNYIRYCGTPLKYSFSEAGHKKSVTLVELREKGTISMEIVELQPLRDLREIRGSYMELTALDYYKDTRVDDYLHVTLTDEEDIPDAIGKLRSIYPNIMKLDYDNLRTSRNNSMESVQNMEEKSPLQLFQEFYQLQNNQEMSREQTEYIQTLMEKVFESGLIQ